MHSRNKKGAVKHTTQIDALVSPGNTGGLRNLGLKAAAALTVAARRTGVSGLRIGEGRLKDWAAPQISRCLYRLTGIGRRSPVRTTVGSMYLPDPPPLSILLGNHEEETTHLVESILRPGMIFVDVGAHAGYFTLCAARKVGSHGKVYAFEPAPQNFDLLKTNVELNALDNVLLVRKAVSDRSGAATLFLNARQAAWHSLYRRAGSGDQTIPIELTTLDESFAAQGWPRIDLIKIDVEGAEAAVLAGMQRLIARCPSLRLIMEVNPSTLHAAGSSAKALISELQISGFQLQILDRKCEGPAQDRLRRLIDSGIVFNILAEPTNVNRP